MRNERARSVVCYAVNGTGVGHIARLLAIARWLRRYSAAIAEPLEIWFLTSSEAEGLAFAEGFAAFKIPSKTIVAEAGIDRTTHVALAKQWVWHTLGLLRPDLLIVDTFPRGSFGELLGALDLCRRKAFIYRPVKREVAERPDFQAMLSLYDLLVVPEEKTEVLVPERAKDRLVHTGPVLGRERWELLPRDVARTRLGVPEGARCVFVSAGGGGDHDAEAQLGAAVRALAADPTLYVVVGTGPLYRGQPFPGLTILPGRAAEWSLAFDAAVSAAGYNTYGELMFAGVPTAFLPQTKIADDQAERAEHAADAGAATLLRHGSSGAEIHDAVVRLLSDPEAGLRARSLVPENCARFAAGELLRLVYPAGSVDRAEQTLDDDRLSRIHALGLAEQDAIQLGHRLARGLPDEIGLAIDKAAEMLVGRDAREAREVRGLVDAIVRGLPSLPVGLRGQLCLALLQELGSLRAGDGAAAKSAVADGRWGANIEEGVATLVREMRPSHTESSSSRRSTK